MTQEIKKSRILHNNEKFQEYQSKLLKNEKQKEVKITQEFKNSKNISQKRFVIYKKVSRIFVKMTQELKKSRIFVKITQEFSRTIVKITQELIKLVKINKEL